MFLTQCCLFHFRIFELILQEQKKMQTQLHLCDRLCVCASFILGCFLIYPNHLILHFLRIQTGGRIFCSSLSLAQVIPMMTADMQIDTSVGGGQLNERGRWEWGGMQWRREHLPAMQAGDNKRRCLLLSEYSALQYLWFWLYFKHQQCLFWPHTILVYCFGPISRLVNLFIEFTFCFCHAPESARIFCVQSIMLVLCCLLAF